MVQRAQVGDGRKPRFHGGTECAAAANLLDREFDVTEPDTAWDSVFTLIRTHEGWMYLAAVIDLLSRQVVGWTMRDRAKTELVVQALLSAVAAQTRLQLPGALVPRVGLHQR